MSTKRTRIRRVFYALDSLSSPHNPRYFSAPFSIQRIPVPHHLKPESVEKQKLRIKARELRGEGESYPEIAELLGISLGGTWNLLNKQSNR